jgi:hypothetical protein
LIHPTFPFRRGGHPKFFEENPKSHRIFTTIPGKVIEIFADNELDAIRLAIIPEVFKHQCAKAKKYNA